MPRRKSPTLTEAELRIMEALWTLGHGSVRQVTGVISGDQPVAYNTVLTMLRILKNKGYVSYHKQGRAFIYKPLVDRGEARAGVLRYLLRRFFDDSPLLLVQNLLENEKIEPDELERLKQKIAEKNQEAP